jgi:methyl-accepting chemotaxis protein
MEGMDRLETIVRAVEEYTAISHLERTSVSLEEIIDQVRADLDLEASKKKKRIDWAVQLAVGEASVEPQMFAQAMKALLLNALESFTGEEGHIAIMVGRENRDLVLEVSDSGAGIDEKDRPFVFDPFFTTKAVGVGMGLSMAERIIAEHRGRIQLESEQGKGTKVTIMLQDGR